MRKRHDEDGNQRDDSPRESEPNRRETGNYESASGREVEIDRRERLGESIQQRGMRQNH